MSAQDSTLLLVQHHSAHYVKARHSAPAGLYELRPHPLGLATAGRKAQGSLVDPSAGHRIQREAAAAARGLLSVAQRRAVPVQMWPRRSPDPRRGSRANVWP